MSKKNNNISDNSEPLDDLFDSDEGVNPTIQRKRVITRSRTLSSMKATKKKPKLSIKRKKSKRSDRDDNNTSSLKSSGPKSKDGGKQKNQKNSKVLVESPLDTKKS